ncbi:BMP family ABC transporter substrate-binding protein [Rossellomorea aquimaris]|uniref:BMP family ABC transporter substrate-binding protein n=1 Tax=Rossellomorea aquimaris TaxID=189382 RepID=A0A5D4U2F5_9BACI|nr:BMP family ABC transporter substrate-binding protein [Rossellomorea aquimaris]TYS81448.1 BMP family ABC transporter substrate-binding protein [Rossellomorea aquimaris]TYS88071.1 BMP family ABC transporter substrate-binding protein [Rossellomorea aquimaris]
MKKLISVFLLVMLVVAGCSTPMTEEASVEKQQSIGILLSDTGLGDGSFNDSAFRGLERARDELGILFDYREAPDGNFEEALQELVDQNHELVIGLGFSIQDAIEKIAKENPDQKFLLIDGYSDVDNITSITFKEHEGSFLLGMVAAMKSKSNTIGFISGADVPVIQRFEKGFEQGAQYINPSIKVLKDNADNFGDAELGGKIAANQMKQGADFIYPAAGFTGVRAIQAAQKAGILSGGVDSDQYFIAEKSVVTSMVKKVDNAVFNITKELISNQKITQQAYELGLKEDGVGLAPIRVTSLSPEETKQLEDAKNKIISGDINIKLQ